ncbi:hypothetical protein [Archaeoglobus veneficus]|uniref:Uncharacterized protein n=1 Tax=Archaeoglobus veneficus (strain DSM 11195 / SNP6) TaxID=693661 RepID=F2KRE7_ARCVS|nr:hypothetical protein [Archaeoglobus veneficus]AEA47881.1 hypothetical protein Arcve_1888 [Archaeoglobus veneficus SNP6]
MYKLFSNVMKANVYLTKLESIERAVLRLLRKRYCNEDFEELNQLINILEFCDKPISEIELASVVLEGLMRDPESVEEEDVQSLLQLIHECKLDLELFIEHHTHTDFVSSVVPREEYEKYLAGLESFLGISTERVNLRDRILEIIYEYPGNYIKSIHNFISKRVIEVSYTTVWKYVNELEELGKILTIGGPQGNLRYCFPNPKEVRNRKEYYGKYFGIQGVIKERITDYFTTSYKSQSFYDFYIVNSDVVPEIILTVGYGTRIKLGSKVEIKAYGLIQSIEYLKESEGYIPKTDFDDLDVLLGWRVTLAENEREVLWADVYNEELKQTLPT